MTFGGLGARARLALPVGFCLFGASTADCTMVTKPKGACWEAFHLVAPKAPGDPKGCACMGYRFCRKIYYQEKPNATTLAKHALTVDSPRDNNYI
ncbi:hypothetical protein M885DRAFT_577528 [Pelagophyceae sp. CCMP2097]|nr:hypothetical protein M885DRAFT_577528 [Pelagophyceae sp. CCMP2097]